MREEAYDAFEPFLIREALPLGNGQMVEKQLPSQGYLRTCSPCILWGPRGLVEGNAQHSQSMYS